MIILTDYGFKPSMLPEDSNGIPARIIAVHKERYTFVCEHGEAYGRLKSSVYYTDTLEDFPTTGDFVLINYNDSGDSQILKTIDRKTKFSRNDFSGHAVGYVKTIKEQVVAANFDYVFIMQSLNLDLNINRLERYLTLAWQSGAVPVVVLTKADLVDDCTKQLKMVEKAAAGCGVYPISAKTGHGLDALSSYLKPHKTIVFLGSSGVGKSSLLNALASEDIMAVKEIREDDSQGRHTTTHRQLIMLPNGVMIIDTPGMREIGMWGVSSGLSGAFTDVEQYLGKCKFSDCKHLTEPGCAIKEAIATSQLLPDRWERYLQIKREAKFADNKSISLRNKDTRNKSLAVNNKHKKKIFEPWEGSYGK